MSDTLNENYTKLNKKYQELKKSQNQIAIEELEKLKMFCNAEIDECNSLLDDESEDDNYLQAVGARISMCYHTIQKINEQLTKLKKV